jgi:hypothetical protein
MITEKNMEDAISADPEKYIGEKGLILVARQYSIGGYIFDLLFEDRHGAKLIVELQRGTLDRYHTYKILDYYDEYKMNNPNAFIELMVIANKIPYERRKRLESHGISYKEIAESEFDDLKGKNNEVVQSYTRINLLKNSDIKMKRGVLDMDGYSTNKYVKFYSDLIERIRDQIPYNCEEPIKKPYYQFQTEIYGVHFEWWYRPKINGLGVELHFENKKNKRENIQMIEQLEPLKDVIEKSLGEEVIYEKEWNYGSLKGASRLFVEKQAETITEELKIWAVVKMVILIKLLQPELKKMIKV